MVSTGVISSHFLEENSNEDGYFALTEANQIIRFQNDNRKYVLNSLLIYTGNTEVKVRIQGTDGYLTIPANSQRGVSEFHRIEYIQVIAEAGTTIKYEGTFY